MLKQWTQARLNELLQADFEGHKLIVVSNRQPYSHFYTEEGLIRHCRPSSGMVTALEPIMNACGGLWIAQGNSGADRDVVDERNHVAVPPDSPRYDLRRVWLTREQIEGHYNGASNQGLWPLCHMTFNKPVFSAAHWDSYRDVNEAFAQAVLEESDGRPAVVLVQDYHFALVPRLLKEADPNLIVAHFWHIPWPNAEIFRSFPWGEELLEGMLGSDMIGFHLPQHCQNFSDCVSQKPGMNAAIYDSGIAHSGRFTKIHAFPISVDYTGHQQEVQSLEVEQETERWKTRLGLDGKMLGIGIDRMDYTKGIPERLRALDRFLELNPVYRERLLFTQIAVPSRSTVPSYQSLAREVRRLVAHINLRWGTSRWRPVTLLEENFGTASMIALHRLANFCVVSSLHDGMNLVAKEFVASRTDENGVLVLSRFAGAADELNDAVLTNPFSVDDLAEAYETALAMPWEERARRMRRMRRKVETNTIYHWAGEFLTNLEVREPANRMAAAAYGD